MDITAVHCTRKEGESNTLHGFWDWCRIAIKRHKNQRKET